MAAKHYIQHYMFSDPNGGHLTQAVTYLETAAFRLKHIQVSSFTYSCIMHVIGILLKLQKLHTKTPCLEFTAKQYLSIYMSRYSDIKIITDSIDYWKSTNNNCCGRWKDSELAY